MKLRKFSKNERKEIRTEMIKNAMAGKGLYLYRNNTNADITLPKPTNSGIRTVAPGKEFQGDNYFMQLVKQGLLRLVKELQSPENQNEGVKMEEKLILDQPDTINNKGKVEHVVSKVVKQINENDKDDEQIDVLLNEKPVESGFLIVEN